MLTKPRPQPDRSLQNKSCRVQEAINSRYKTPPTSESRFDFPVRNDASPSLQGFPHVENFVCKAAENSLQGVSMKGYTTRSTRSMSSTQHLSLGSSFGTHHSTSFRSEDIRGIGVWTSADRPSSGILHNISPSISLNESPTTAWVDKRNFCDGRIAKWSEKVQMVKDVDALFR